MTTRYRFTTGLLDAGPLARALASVIQGRAPEELLDKYAVLRRKAFQDETNIQAIEMKRLVQIGGHGHDPLGVRSKDSNAEKSGMLKYMAKVNPNTPGRGQVTYCQIAVT